MSESQKNTALKGGFMLEFLCAIGDLGRMLPDRSILLSRLVL
ncbi:Uncharacterised protein [Actinobacillus ureae]|nr:Uncharacterised protein [Actinobacillus ureae]